MCRNQTTRRLIVLYILAACLSQGVADAVAARELNVLFLGDDGPHQPRVRFPYLATALSPRGIQLHYTDRTSDLTLKKLKQYDALAVYANIDRIDRAPAQAILEYVEAGHGFVPIHCASYCFRNSPKLVALMGAQFQRHGTGVFRTSVTATSHPVINGFQGFESWDETYVHHQHNDKNRTVLSYRVDKEGREPWTWVRTHGAGRVFYTAWGHDQRTWSHPGFHNLMERGVRWAAHDDPGIVPPYDDQAPIPDVTMRRQQENLPPFAYVDVGAKIPNYPESERWGTQAEPMRMMQRPLPASESKKHMVTPNDFRVELFAADPDIQGKPICMTWDHRGRLWVAETYDYPNQLQPPGQGRDRIRICEDTDGDWQADKFTVFAENLSIPTTMTFYRDGVIVQDGTETVFLKDHDGDDVADERTVLFDNWNQRDTHGGVSNFQYGLDNWIWAMQGYNPSRPTIDGQPQQRFRMGYFRFRPDGSSIEFLRSTDNNTWGLGIREDGLVFGSTANRNPSTYLAIPNRCYEQVRGWTPSLTLHSIADTYLFQPITDKVRQVDQHGGYTAAAGHAIYTARQYPRVYWNQTAFVCGPTGHLVGTFMLRNRGSVFQSQYAFNLLASDDEWTAPIMAEVGPDGNVWVIDWYNFIVQHNPTPTGFETGKGNAYETELRDKRRGRIYRVVYDPSGEGPVPTLDKSDPEGLVAALGNPTLLWRRHAQRLLVERGRHDVLPGLIELVDGPQVDSIGLNTAAIHALWTLHGLSSINRDHPQVLAAAVRALQHASAGVRRNAIEVLPVRRSTTREILECQLLVDRDPHVRLAALLKLSELPPSQIAAEALTTVFADPNTYHDRWLTDALTTAAARHDHSFLMATGSLPTPDAARKLLRTVASHYARGAPTETAAQLLGALAGRDAQLAQPVIEGMAAGWPSEVQLTPTDQQLEQLEQLAENLDSAGQGHLVRLTSRWGVTRFQKYAQQVLEGLFAQLDDDSQSDQDRLRAVAQLIEFQPTSNQIIDELLSRLTPRTSPTLARGIVSSIRRSDAPEAGAILAAEFRSFTPSLRAIAIATMLQRESATRALLDALENGQVQLSDLALDHKQALATHPNRRIRRRASQILEQGGALPDADRQMVLDQLMPITRETGSVQAGKEAFKKACAKCHRHGSEGTRIGPDLTGMAVHPKHELLVQIIDPSRSVENNFRTYTVVTTDGQVLTGMLAAESKTAIELFNAEGKKQTVLRQDIDELVASSQSLMPEGFEKQLSRKELRDLLEFLTARGQFVPVDISKAATIASDRGMFNARENRVERLDFDSWSHKTTHGVPFLLIDPQNGRIPNAIMLHGPNGVVTRRMPKQVELRAGGPVEAIHMLSGVSGWGFPASPKGSVSMIVRLHYEDGQTEDHKLLNGVHFADYIRRVDVPKSDFAFNLNGRQIRYLKVDPQRDTPIETVQLVKGPDSTSPVVMAVTLESPSS